MKCIKISPAQQNLILQKFQTFLAENRFSDNKINFSETIEQITDTPVQKPIVAFTPTTWMKIRKLIDVVDTEVGWHGVVDHNPATNMYIIQDILVYPQQVSGATVTTDELEYSNWLMALDDDIFPKVRYQGHSHVNFGVAPSGVDQHFYDSILQTLQQDEYYIFMIANKRGDINIWIYDFAQNIIFDKADITIKVLCKGGDITSWSTLQIQKYVTKQIPTIQTSNFGTVRDRFGNNYAVGHSTQTELTSQKQFNETFFTKDKEHPSWNEEKITRNQYLGNFLFSKWMEQKHGKKYKQFTLYRLSQEFKDYCDIIKPKGGSTK